MLKSSFGYTELRNRKYHFNWNLDALRWLSENLKYTPTIILGNPHIMLFNNRTDYKLFNTTWPLHKNTVVKFRTEMSRMQRLWYRFRYD